MVKKKLLDFEKAGRPLVVNLEVFPEDRLWTRWTNLKKVVTDFAHHVDFIVVYLREADPLDEWYVYGMDYDIYQHKTIDDRITAAHMLKDCGMPCPIILDTMDDESVFEFAALPEAFYIIENGVVQLKGLGPFRYNPQHVRKWLDNYVKRH